MPLLRLLLTALALQLVLIRSLAAADKAPTTGDAEKTRVFICGHSFHVFVANQLPQVTTLAGIQAKPISGVQSLGGSQVIQHWKLPDEKDVPAESKTGKRVAVDRLRKAIKAGEVDVLTVAPNVQLPDPGIDNYANLLLEHNPGGRLYIQASWFPFDRPDKRGTLQNAERDGFVPAELRKLQAPFFEAMAKQARELNEKFAPQTKRQVVFVIPVGEAVLRLREKVVAGEVPGIARQSDLFTDSIGHAKAPVTMLCTYTCYAAIYGRSPVGLGVPPALKNDADPAAAERLNGILQQIAWDAVTNEPLTGVKIEAK
ncbi:MAG: hypothetical protein SFU86_05180 [Pirellulaceae bacterium]|nr:hypothetical protein [Pirellulaceae bacterium]